MFSKIIQIMDIDIFIQKYFKIQFNTVTYHKITQNCYISILYDRLSYDKKYDG